MDDAQLLRQYVEGQSEEAFGELVSRHIDLVYSAALRMASSDSHLAEDVTQMVFIDLARKVRSLPRGVLLAGWLYRHTCYTAAKAVRTERRRRAREQTAMEIKALDDNIEEPWERIAPHLDEGLTRLSASDREALVLRFLKRQDLRAVGAAFGISEDAAQKRVTRALDKLRGVLGGRGVELTVTTLATALAAQAVTAAPAGLAVSVAAASMTAAADTGMAFTLLKLMAATKLKTSIISAIVIASLAAPLIVQRQAQARLREQDEALRIQTIQLAQLQVDSKRLSNRVAQARSSLALSKEEFSELLKLRGEIGLLRKSAGIQVSPTPAPSGTELLSEIEKESARRVNLLKQWLEANPSQKIPELQFVSENNWIDAVYPRQLETEEEYRRAMSLVRANAEMVVMSQLITALHQYLPGHNGQFPTDLAELAPFLKPPVDGTFLGRYQIVPASNLVTQLRGDEGWAITQKAPVDPEWDVRFAVDSARGRTADCRITNRWVAVR